MIFEDKTDKEGYYCSRVLIYIKSYININNCL